MISGYILIEVCCNEIKDWLGSLTAFGVPAWLVGCLDAQNRKTGWGAGVL